MPGIAERAAPALLCLFEHGDDIGMLRQVRDIGDAQDRPEAAGQRDLLFGAQTLSTEEEYEMIEEGLPYLAERTVIETSKIDPRNFSAESPDRIHSHH